MAELEAYEGCQVVDLADLQRSECRANAYQSSCCHLDIIRGIQNELQIGGVHRVQNDVAIDLC